MIELEVLGARLKEVRLQFGLTQKEVADKLGVNQNVVTRVEKGGLISASVLTSFLSFWSQYTSLDVIFDDNAWQLAQEEKSLLIKKIHLNSVVKEKLSIMKKNISKQLMDNRNSMVASFRELDEYIQRGFTSTITLVDDEPKKEQK